MQLSPKARARAHQHATHFLKKAKDFHLGNLPTEQQHPRTHGLSEMAHNDLPRALALLQSVDVEAVSEVVKKEEEILRLAAEVESTLREGGRVFFYGCGATGRLALSIETLWRMEVSQEEKDLVIGFMSGGDLALVHSIENFEDHPEFGARQLREIGFSKNDLLISCTEGGETPSVIGATEEAVKISKRKPWFLYCNPDSILEKVARSKRVLKNTKIEKICLAVGPMSLSGSTRLQATTVLQLAAGWALLQHQPGYQNVSLGSFYQFLKRTDYTFLTSFVEAESAAYKKGEFLLYETKEYAITLLTDTTERSPTFSLPGFENQREPKTKAALAYLMLTGAEDSESAWEQLLLRKPRPLEWKILKGVAGKKRLYGFDFSQQVQKLREKKLAGAKQHQFIIERKEEMEFRLGRLRHSVKVEELPSLFEHLFLKMLMNAHSLLVMARIGRIESNVMTWVRPSNNKLIDRAIRYVEYLLKKRGYPKYSYEQICHQLFLEVEALGEGESVVLNTVRSLAAKSEGLKSSSGNLRNLERKALAVHI
jgi:N-acetylmuramic acid 6-phosphate etherase